MFDYSSLDTDTAAKLEELANTAVTIKRNYIIDMANLVYSAHELLVSHYGGKFGEWCECIGIGRSTAQNMVKVVQLLHNSTDEECRNLEQLAESNVKLLYEIARPSAPAELVEQVKSGDITTHKDYIEMKNKLKETEEKLEEADRTAGFWKKAQSDTHKENQQLRADRVTAMSRADNAERELEKAQSRIKDLESRPVEVAVQPDTAALEEKDRQIEKLKSQLSAEVASVDELNRKNAELRNELEQQENDDVKIFAVKLTYEQLEKLIEIADLQNYYHIAQALKKAQSIRIK